MDRNPDDSRSEEHPYDKEIWGVALPALASMLLEPVLGVINAGMVGRLGTQQLGAASVGIMVCNFATFLFSFLLFLTTPEVAAAMVKKDRAEVSRISAKSFWVAGVFGVLTTALLILCADRIIALIAPPEPEVVRYAIEYVSIRAWGILPVLLSFVATGTFRGFKDTRTPLYAAVGSATCSLGLSYVFIYVLQLGVKGSAMAVAMAQAVSTTALCGLMLGKGMLRIQDLLTPPSLASVLPMLRKGAVLGVRNVISFGMVLYGSALCVRAGSTYQAAFEVIRQVWLLTIQFFECLNVATQTLCAAYLGSGDRQSALAVLKRLLQLGMTVGAVAGVVVFGLQSQLAGFFSRDAGVIAQVLTTLPLVCLCFPFDAAASILDGSLLASKQTDYMSIVQILGSVAQYFVLISLASNNSITCLSIWATLKVLTGVRFVGGSWRAFFSAKSAYLPDRKQRAAAAAAAVPAVPAAAETLSAKQVQSTPPLAAAVAAPAEEVLGQQAPVQPPQVQTVIQTEPLKEKQPVKPPVEVRQSALPSIPVVAAAALEAPVPLPVGAAAVKVETTGTAKAVAVVATPQGAGAAEALISVEAYGEVEAMSFGQDALSVDFVPCHVCAAQEAQEQGNRAWHAAHNGKCVPVAAGGDGDSNGGTEAVKPEEVVVGASR